MLATASTGAPDVEIHRENLRSYVGVTARLSIDFKLPISVGQTIRAEGWITRSRRRVVDTQARVIDAETGEVLATAVGVYMAADETRKQELRARYGWRPLDDGATPERADGR